MVKQDDFLIDEKDQRIITWLQSGLAVCSRPYAAIADEMGLDEAEVLQRIERLWDLGSIKRMGIIVRHHELGYQANAMVVWDVPDQQVDQVGQCLSQFEFITLCYQRPRRLPEWPYNLFCMIHGKDQDSVRQRIAQVREQCEFDFPYQVLFSRRRFKQRGALHSVRADLCAGQEDKADVDERLKKAQAL